MFWNKRIPNARPPSGVSCLTDISLLGGLIIASADTAGKPSLGWRGPANRGAVDRQRQLALPAGLGGADADHLAERVGAPTGRPYHRRR